MNTAEELASLFDPKANVIKGLAHEGRADPDARYQLLQGQYIDNAGKLHIAGRPGLDICTQDLKHPRGLDRYPEKFRKIVSDRFIQAIKDDETIEELELRLAAKRAQLASAANGTIPEASKTTPQANGGLHPDVQAMIATIEGLSDEDLQKYAQQEQVTLGKAKKRTDILDILKKHLIATTPV